MFRTHAIIATFAATCVIATSFVSPQAHAVQRTHVSAAFGSDGNTASSCSAAAPCRFFAAAMSVTDNNGEVIVLDSGGYGTVTITRSVALIAPTGVYAGISVFPGANGVTIATPLVNVVLRGLTINGQGGTHGINMTAGNSLTVENCVIANLTQHGINVNAVTNVNITDSMVRRNGGNGIHLLNGVKATLTRAVVSGNSSSGIRVEGNVASTTTADIADSTVDGSGIGVSAFSFNATAVVKVSLRDSRAVRNASYGLLAQSTAGAAVSLSASNNIVANNNNRGIGAFFAGTKVWASGNTVSDNGGAGLQNNFSALFETAGNNAVRNNGANIGTITAIATQ